MIRGWLRWAALLLVGLILAGAGWYLTLPDGSEFARKNPDRSAMMRHREAGGIRGRQVTWLPLSRMAPTLRHAVIVAEDANYYRHHGVDWEATWSALERNWNERRLYRGGSTITQQLAKNLYLDPEKTLWRKVTEAMIARRMERQLSKARILELYLNVVEWGRGIYGAEAAARHHFGTSAAELTIGEAAWLAAILPAPLRYEGDPGAVTARAVTIGRFVARRLPARVPPPPPTAAPAPPPGPPPEADEVAPESPEELRLLQETRLPEENGPEAPAAEEVPADEPISGM